MSGTFPVSPSPMRVSIRSMTPAVTSVSLSMKRYMRLSGAHRWAVDLMWNNLTKSQAATLWGFILKQKGQTGTFKYSLHGYEALGDYTGSSPSVDGSGQEGTSVLVKGLEPNKPKVFSAGDYVRFGTQDKVYCVVEDTGANGTGGAILPLSSVLVSPSVNGETVYVGSAVEFTMGLQEQEHQWSRSRAGAVDGFSLRLLEVP